MAASTRWTDIPPANQRLLLRARGVARPQWWLNGKRLGAGASLPWFPWPGRHALELRDAKGLVVEKSASKCAARWPYLAERPASPGPASTNSRKRRSMP